MFHEFLFAGSATPQVTGHFTPGLSGTERLGRIVSALSTCGSDIICLQEVHSDDVLSALQRGLAGKYKVLTSQRANIPARLALEALHVICGLLVALIAHVATVLVLPESPLFVEDALSAVADAIAYVAPFALGYWGGRFCTRRSALSTFLRCSVHGGRESVACSLSAALRESSPRPTPLLQLQPYTTRHACTCARTCQRRSCFQSSAATF